VWRGVFAERDLLDVSTGRIQQAGSGAVHSAHAEARCVAPRLGNEPQSPVYFAINMPMGSPTPPAREWRSPLLAKVRPGKLRKGQEASQRWQKHAGEGAIDRRVLMHNSRR
jgi:hypothetical protein